MTGGNGFVSAFRRQNLDPITQVCTKLGWIEKISGSEQRSSSESRFNFLLIRRASDINLNKLTEKDDN
jgi:hypothetical protein